MHEYIYTTVKRFRVSKIHFLMSFERCLFLIKNIIKMWNIVKNYPFSVFNVHGPSEIILICWFGADLVLVFINVENRCDA